MALLEISKQSCRICFEATDNMVPLSWNENGTTLAEMLCICVNLEFHESDGLPFQCCVGCKGDLIVAHALLVRCRLSDTKFRLLLEETKPTIRDTPSTFPMDEVFVKTELETSIDCLDPVTNRSSENFMEEDDGNYVQHNDIEDGDDLSNEEKGNAPKDVRKVRRKGVKRKMASIPKRCCNCKTRFESLEQVEQHTKMHLNSKVTDPEKVSARPFECNVCFKRYTQKRALQIHQRVMYVDELFKCDECDQDFTSENQLISHKESHSKEVDERNTQLPKCCACYEQFESEESLQKHCEQVHLPESHSSEAGNGFACSICYRRFKTRKLLLSHKQKPYRIKQYQCSQCGKIFRKKCILADHERFHHGGERPFVCPVCSKTFAIKDSFCKHVKSHAIEDDHFKCETCGKGFKTKSNLKDHYITHASSDYRPLACSLCPATFARKTCLKSHMRMHTGEKPFKCQMCDASYPFSSDLKRHMVGHTGIQPYVCNVCGRGYPRKDYLRKHMASHNQD